jgi:hypothetical protein
LDVKNALNVVVESGYWELPILEAKLVIYEEQLGLNLITSRTLLLTTYLDGHTHMKKRIGAAKAPCSFDMTVSECHPSQSSIDHPSIINHQSMRPNQSIFSCIGFCLVDFNGCTALLEPVG